MLLHLGTATMRIYDYLSTTARLFEALTKGIGERGHSLDDTSKLLPLWSVFPNRVSLIPNA